MSAASETGGVLSRGRLGALGIATLTLAAIAVLLLAFGRDWWEGKGGSYAPKRPVARASISPSSALFGDTLTARLDVLVDPRRVDPASVEAAPTFAPFRIVSQSRRQTDGPGRSALVQFSYSIQCLTAACVPLMVEGSGAGRQTRAIKLGPPGLTAKAPNGHPVRIPASWPTFVMHSRLSGQEIAEADPQVAPTFSPPAPSWRITPNTAGGAALVVAVLLVLTAGWLVISPLARDTRRLRVPRIPKHLTPVERALRLAEHAAASGELDEERKALQRLAVELERQGSAGLAGRAGRLAWSEGDPTPDTVGALAEDVRSNGAH